MWNLYKIVFFNLLIMGTLICISAYNWFSMWLGLEINLISIIPLFKSSSNIYPAEATIKYFITQALASMFIMFTIIISMNFIDYFFNSYLMMIMNSALFTKLGAAPFHAWFPEVSEGLDWSNNFILMTWQKIAPSIILMYNINLTFFTIIILSSLIVGGIYGINQTSLRKILAYSSINHIGWLLASLLYLKMIWLNYFLIYTLTSLNIMMIFHYMKMFFIAQLKMFNTNKLIKIIFMFNFLSLGGLPPFLGFYPKWLTLNYLINKELYILSIMMVIMTLLTLFFYIRLTFPTMTLMSMETMNLNITLHIKSILILNSIILMSLVISINLFNFF